MPTSLKTIKNKLAVRVRALDAAFDRHIITPVTVRRIDRFALQEGLISALWQAWGRFCRDAIIRSVQGALTEQGTLTTSIYSARRDMEVAYIALQLSRNQTVGNVKALSGSYQEPTWGDAIKLNRISSGLQSSNAQTLMSAFSACSVIMDLKLCRNANAHLSSDMINGIRAAQVRYRDTQFKHPSDMMTWVETSTQDYLWKAWVDEVLLISDLAIK